MVFLYQNVLDWWRDTLENWFDLALHTLMGFTVFYLTGSIVAVFLVMYAKEWGQVGGHVKQMFLEWSAHKHTEHLLPSIFVGLIMKGFGL